MNNVNVLTHLIEQQPECDVYAACLTDALIEERDMVPSEAARIVDSVRRHAIVARDIAFAADLIARKGPAYRALLKEVERVCTLQMLPAFTMYVVSGSSPPSVMAQTDDDGMPLHPPVVSVYLPASWVWAWHHRTGHSLGTARRGTRAAPRRQHVRR